jgi:DNA-binding LacI/PurR family transcriptional regulator
MRKQTKYEAAAELIIAEILPGLEPGMKLPPEAELARRAGVSMMTLRHSIQLLHERGYVIKKPEYRAVVAEPGGRRFFARDLKKILIVRMQDDIAYTEQMMLLQQALLQDAGVTKYSPIPFYMPFFNGSKKELETKTVETLCRVAGETQCDAVILLPGIVFELKIQRELERMKIPLIVSQPREASENYIYFNMAAGAYSALQHLYQIGCRHIRYIGGMNELFWERSLGVKRFLREYDPKSDPAERMTQCLGTIDDGYETFCRLQGEGCRIDGILAHNDLCAIGISMAARKFGIRVPRELAIVGFDDLEHTHRIFPQLTSVAAPNKRLAEEMLKSLDFIFDHPGVKVSNRSELYPQLHIRKSSGGFRGK